MIRVARSTWTSKEERNVIPGKAVPCHFHVTCVAIIIAYHHTACAVGKTIVNNLSSGTGSVLGYDHQTCQCQVVI
jgi:hypothetical protein